MGEFSIWHWLVVGILFAFVFFVGRYGMLIARRAGLSGVWGVLFAVPVVGAVALWYVAMVKWPAVERMKGS